MVSGPSSWSPVWDPAKETAGRVWSYEAKSDPSGEVFISEQSIIWERKAQEESITEYSGG